MICQAQPRRQCCLRAHDLYDSGNSLKAAIKLNVSPFPPLKNTPTSFHFIQYMLQGAACDTMGFHFELHQNLPSPRHPRLPDTPSPAHRDPGTIKG